MKGWVRAGIALLGLLCLLALPACAGRGEEKAEGGLVERAAAEATAIIQQAQATALVLQAQATATALMQRIDATATAPHPTSIPPTPAPSPTPAPQTSREDRSPTPAAGRTSITQAASSTEVEVVGVGFAADGGFIMVQFKAPPRVADGWWQGSVSVVDEATGTVYNEIPVMPKIGPLIGKPKREGQLGYVMLVNPPPGLRSGALVTVVLGTYEFEHVAVK